MYNVYYVYYINYPLPVVNQLPPFINHHLTLKVILKQKSNNFIVQSLS